MRTKPKTILLAKIRRHIRAICERYHTLENLKYPDCFNKPQEAIEKTAIKILNEVKKNPNTKT